MWGGAGNEAAGHGWGEGGKKAGGEGGGGWEGGGGGVINGSKEALITAGRRVG